MNVPLPAGLDLYLTGIKSHSSEQRLTAYLLKALRQGIVAIDAGAHLGYYSLIMHHCMGPAGRVLAFEPSAQIYPWLVRNTQVHAGIQTVQMMLGVREGTTAYHEFDLLHSESSTGQPGIALQREHQERMVPVTTLGAYCRAHGIRPSFIKIDVEGGELQVLQGAGDVLADVGAVVAEMRKEDFDQRYAPVEELMREYLFQPYRIDDEGDLHALDDVREHLMQLSEESDNLVFSKTSRR
jgi:FkbM family methyltransferase